MVTGLAALVWVCADAATPPRAIRDARQIGPSLFTGIRMIPPKRGCHHPRATRGSVAATRTPQPGDALLSTLSHLLTYTPPRGASRSDQALPASGREKGHVPRPSLAAGGGSG